MLPHCSVSIALPYCCSDRLRYCCAAVHLWWFTVLCGAAVLLHCCETVQLWSFVLLWGCATVLLATMLFLCCATSSFVPPFCSLDLCLCTVEQFNCCCGSLVLYYYNVALILCHCAGYQAALMVCYCTAMLPCYFGAMQFKCCSVAWLPLCCAT